MVSEPQLSELVLITRSNRLQMLIISDQTLETSTPSGGSSPSTLQLRRRAAAWVTLALALVLVHAQASSLRLASCTPHW